MIIEELERRASNDSSPHAATAKLLSGLLRYLISQAQPHLKQIIVQHPGFDIHDELHSSRVIANIEALLGSSGVESCSIFELFMLVASAYLHDCAMALPQWELNLLGLTEGIRSQDTNLEVGARNDLKPKVSFEDAKLLIHKNDGAIFGTHGDSDGWLFSPRNMRENVEDLAIRLRDYQDFRSGHSEELRNLQAYEDHYLVRSEQLRQDFIRHTHSTRIERWVRNLDKLFQERLEGQWGKALAHDLAAICRSHGEGDDFVKRLPSNVVYFGDPRSDLRIVAMMLRIGDIVHFTADRAPLVLFRQKLISSPVSRQHWKVKNEGISYSISESTLGEKVVHFAAYFQTPSLYFLFQEYLDLIDSELALYNTIKSRVTNTNSTIEHTFPRLAQQVDRSAIRYDEQHFQPVHGMRFSLDQKKILNLLMGVKLYKDKFACLRELYQNSLDACRCMMAAQATVQQIGQIEFGIGLDETSGDRYVYCRDNGIGMTNEIVNKYLLHIGNSFYQSSEYQRLATNWQSSFTPVSQFGIGILSCFMLGKRMQVVSKHLSSGADLTTPICFMMDGPHEHFYYVPPSVSDVEAIGQHGTIVRVFLDEEVANQLHDHPASDFAFLQHITDKLAHESTYKTEVEDWKLHLYRRIASFVAECPSKINVVIRQTDGSSIKLLPSTTPFDYKALGVSRQKIQKYESEKDKHHNHGGNPSYLSVIDNALPRRVSVSYENVEFGCIISFPNPGYTLPASALGTLGTVSMDSGVLIDGIIAGASHIHPTREVTEALSRVGVLNFTGRFRPILSVDRCSVVEWPDNIEFVMRQLATRLADKLIQEVQHYAKRNSFDYTSPELNILWESLFLRFGFLASNLIIAIVKEGETQVPQKELSTLTNKPTTINEFVKADRVTIQFKKYASLLQTTRLLLFAKFAGASRITVENDLINVISGTFESIENCYDWDHFRHRQYIFFAEEWLGDSEYFDIHSAVWPIIPQRLFEKIHSRYGEAVSINQRTKQIEDFSNGLSAIAKFDPLLIQHKLGIYKHRYRSWPEKMPTSSIYRFEDAQNNFWFSNLEERTPDQTRKSRYLVFAFVAPRKLSNQETIDIARYRQEDPEYVKGVEHGWSMMFLSDNNLNVIIRPGKVSRQDLIAAVPEEFWTNNPDTTYSLLNGELLSDFVQRSS